MRGFWKILDAFALSLAIIGFSFNDEIVHLVIATVLLAVLFTHIFRE